MAKKISHAKKVFLRERKRAKIRRGKKIHAKNKVIYESRDPAEIVAPKTPKMATKSEDL